MEHYYRIAIEYKNNSCWKSLEKLFDRQPFILDGKRIYENETFYTRQIGDWGNFKCTGWNEKKEIKFVEYRIGWEGEHRRHTFDNKSFKEFIKGKKFEF